MLNNSSESTSKLREADVSRRSGQARGNEGKPNASEAGKAGAPQGSVQLSGAGQVLAESLGSLSSSHDVDTNRVAAIRSAIEQGTYHVDPQRLASNFVDLETQLFGA